MKATKLVFASPDFIYEKIIQSSLSDVQKQSGRKISLSKLSGFTYQKVFANGHRGTIKFDEVKKPCVYAFSTDTPTHHYTTRWELEKVNEKLTRVMIAENSGAKEWRQYTADKLFELFMGQQKKRQLFRILKEIEAEYKKSEAKNESTTR